MGWDDPERRNEGSSLLFSFKMGLMDGCLAFIEGDGMKGGGDHMRDDRSLMGWFVPFSSSDPLSLIAEDEG